MHVVVPGDEVSDEMLLAGIHEGALLEPLFKHFLQPFHARFATGVALDVGANIGNHSLYFSRFFPRVLSVEPNPVTLNVLRANAALSGADVTVLPMGFGNANGSLQFWSNRAGNLGASGFAFADGPTGERNGQSIECPIRRGDEVLAELSAGPVALIKLDVEGAELSALQGLGECLRRDQPLVIFECLKAAGEGGGDAIFAYLRERGYDRFFVVESSVSAARRPVGGWLRRLLQGERVALRAVDKPVEGEPWLMVLALPVGAVQPVGAA
ncbi:FkbM family methyltransferase [Viridibacterium curvum]|uniref:FkbM family methyltransferase n=2 Tax=Viridibacterium curvum TaxID=1101404 RepID=A0ABP9QAN0_9RHOO